MNPRILQTTRFMSAIAALMVLVCAAPAVAQVQRQPRGYRGLFGGNEADPDSRQSLNFSFSVNGGYDDNATAGEGGGTSNPRFQQASTFLGGSAGLSYGRRWDRATLGASASASTRFYQDIPELETSTSYGGAIGLAVNLGPRTDLSFSQSVSYSPYYQFGFLPPVFAPGPGDVIAPNPDLVVAKREALSYATSVNLSRRLSRRGSFGFQYGHSRRDYSDEAFGRWASHHVGGAYTYALSRGLSLNAGYSYRRARHGSSDDAAGRNRDMHGINAGVNYNRTLSFSRQTTLSFATGSAMAKGLDREGRARTHYRVIGNAALNHQIGRSWTATLGYSRGFGFADGFDDLYYSDSVVGSVGGYWGPRTTLSASVRWSNGRIGLEETNRFDTLSFAAEMGFAVNRFTNLSAQAFYYRYDFDTAPFPDYPTVLDRVGVRGGVSFWLPLLR